MSAETLKGSLTTMERQIQRLENDIENFPKTDDKKDKFVEKMSISFFMVAIFTPCIGLFTFIHFLYHFVNDIGNCVCCLCCAWQW